MKKRFLFCFLFPLLFLWLSPQAMAVGTPVGTSITNQAYVDYNDANGNALSRVFSNIVTTTVSQVAGVALLPPDSTVVGAPGSTVYFVVDVKNTGNGEDVYDFTIDPPTGFTPDSVTFYYDKDDSGTLTAGDEVIDPDPVSGVYTTGAVPADGTYPILVEAVIPAGQANGDTSVSTGTITSQFDTGVFEDGSFTIIVTAAVIEATKTHSPLSPIPEETVTYTITLENTGSEAGTTAVVTDPIPASMSFVSGSIRLDTGSGYVDQTDADDGDDADFDVTNAGSVTVNVGTIAADDIVRIEFKATLNAGVTAGTSITNQADVNYSYTVGTDTFDVSETTNGDTFTVANDPAVSVTAGTTSATGDPGDTITYAITVTNNGNAADVIDMTYTSSEGWTWNLWYDANNDGIAGNDGDYLLTDSDGDGIVDTGSIPQGGSVSILAVTTIPAGTANGSVDTLVVTGTSSVNTSVSGTSGNLLTTVTAPVLAISKSVSPTGNQPPGTTLTYTVTVTNNGSGVATAVIITDIIPNFTTYVVGSIKIGATVATLAPKTDAADGDGAQYDSGSKAVIAGGASKSLGVGGTFVLQFQTKID